MAKTDANALFDAIVDMPFTPEVLALLHAAERMRKSFSWPVLIPNGAVVKEREYAMKAYDRAKRRILQ